jgi:hypothetical protein
LIVVAASDLNFGLTYAADNLWSSIRTHSLEGVSETLQEKPAAPLDFRDRVEIRHSRGLRGRIVEPRGPIGLGGIPGYRVVVRRQAPGTKPIRPTSI